MLVNSVEAEGDTGVAEPGAGELMVVNRVVTMSEQESKFRRVS